MPKTRSGEREIPLADRMIEVIRHQKDNSVASSQGYIFISKKGMPINKHLDRVWARALRKAGMRHPPSYQLRHTFATQCIINGLPLPYIAKILGHSTIDTLIRHYTGWIDSATKQHDALLRDSFRQTIAKTESKRNSAKHKPPKLGSKLNYLLVKKAQLLSSRRKMGQTRGFEPPRAGTTTRSLNHLATPAIYLYILKLVSISPVPIIKKPMPQSQLFES